MGWVSSKDRFDNKHTPPNNLSRKDVELEEADKLLSLSSQDMMKDDHILEKACSSCYNIVEKMLADNQELTKKNVELEERIVRMQLEEQELDVNDSNEVRENSAESRLDISRELEERFGKLADESSLRISQLIT